jgi:type IV fimbrial biogenesis protein FimT
MRYLTSTSVRHARRRPQGGMTLIELVVGLAIAALLGMAAAPFFAEYTTNSKLREGGNLLLAETLVAQSEAIKRNRTVRVSSAGAVVQVLDMGDPANPVVLRESLLSRGITASTTTIDFGSEGRPVPFGTGGAIDVSMTGISCSADKRCPGLRVDAGGAVRLCGDRINSCP